MRPRRKHTTSPSIKRRLALLLSLCALPPLALYSAGIRDSGALFMESMNSAKDMKQPLAQFRLTHAVSDAYSRRPIRRVHQPKQPAPAKLDPGLPALLLPMVLANQLKEILDGPGKSYKAYRRQSREAVALTRIGAPLVPIMIQALKNHRQIGLVLDMFHRISPEVKDAVPLLMDALQNRNADVRFAAARALARLIRPAAPPRLLQLLNHPDAHVRAPALEAAARSGLYSLRTLPALRFALDDPEPEVRLSIYLAATQMKNRPMTAKALAEKLHEEDGHLQRSILRALGNLDARPWVEHILPLLDHSDARTRRYALEAIARGAKMPPMVFPLALAGLEDEDHDMRAAAARILRRSNRKLPRAVIPGLTRNMSLRHGWLDWESALLLIHMRATEAIPALRKLTRAERIRSRHLARYAIREILKKTDGQ